VKKNYARAFDYRGIELSKKFLDLIMMTMDLQILAIG
jgi:hypothetical protein